MTNFRADTQVPTLFSIYQTHFGGTVSSPGDYRNVHLNRHLGSVNLNATKTFWHDRISLQLKVNDIFNTQKDGNEIYSDRMTMNLLNTYDYRAVSLTLRYQLNPKDYKQHSHSNIDSELKRL